MAPSPSVSRRVVGSLGAIGAALAWTSLSFGVAIAPSPAQAEAPAAYYRAELAQPAAQPRAVAGDLVWSCNGTSCVAGKGTSRPLRICREVNRKLGAVTAFTARGEALPAEDLAKCNA